MMTMIERVAESQANFDGRKLSDMPKGERERYRQRARLAIEAMRVPTPLMEQEAYDHGNEGRFVDGWEIMIDAALMEPWA